MRLANPLRHRLFNGLEDAAAVKNRHHVLCRAILADGLTLQQLTQRAHDRQQPEVSAAHLIERLSPARGLVVDPMCGSGTTLVAAKQLGRRWLGIELDKGVAAVARCRLNGS